MVLWSLGSPSMTGRKFTSLALSAWILSIQPFQLQCWKSGSWPFNTHTAAQSVSPGERFCVTEKESTWWEENGVHPCVFVAGEGKNLYVSCIQHHSFNFTIPTVCYCRRIICWGWCWRDDFHHAHRMKRGVAINRNDIQIYVVSSKLRCGCFSSTLVFVQRCNQFRILKYPYFDCLLTAQSKLIFSYFWPIVFQLYPYFQRLSRVFLGELTLKFLIYVTRHHYEHIGEENFW